MIFPETKREAGIPEASWSFRHSSQTLGQVPQETGQKLKSRELLPHREHRGQLWAGTAVCPTSGPPVWHWPQGGGAYSRRQEQDSCRRGAEGRVGRKRWASGEEGGPRGPGQVLYPLPFKETVIWEMIFFNCILTEFLHLPTK